MGERETWTTEEFGSSHAGAVGVLLADGSVPASVFFGMNSGGGGRSVSEWSVYDGRFAYGPRAAALRAVCSCGWNGPEHELDWDMIGERKLIEAAGGTADTCAQDWDAHTVEVEQSAIPLPETVTALLAQLQEEIEKLAKTSPLAAVRAARRLEVAAGQVGYGPAHEARQDTTAEQAAAALGLTEEAARKLMARFGGWSPYC
ncbi:hypothetical protein OIU91_40240 [Streptomyces sp. NBC_01456]|uniref:hypothetical protein n=1 Tax=unclassified Streptomyces TaxID=2593676 RepID=UPI002E3339A3|nr:MULTISPECIES: hypothetical protein [unclassified Streptomyces]